MTNFSQILDEIQQQKVSAATAIDSTTAQIQQAQAEIGLLQSRLLDLHSQLAALTTLEAQTTELADATQRASELVPVVPTSSFVNHRVSG